MLIKVTPEQIIKIGGPTTNKQLANELSNFITTQGDKFFLDTPRRIAEFLGQTAAESGGYTRFIESLKYSAERLTKVWPRHFKTIEFAKNFAANERKLGNYIYGQVLAKNLGNRPGTEDGYNLRGRGLKQLTGYDNVSRFTAWAKKKYPDAPDFVKNPEKLTEYPWMILSAVWFWVTNEVYKYADKDDTVGATKAINGGTNGLADRQAYVNKAKKIIVNIPHVPTSKVVEVKPSKPDAILKEYQTKLNAIATYKKQPDFNVGKADGWHGVKTEKAIKAFQTSTGTLTATGTLDAATKEAIDNVMIVVNGGKQTTVAEDIQQITTAISQPIIEEIPVAVPVELPPKLIESINKPVIRSTTLWATVSSVSAFGLMVYEKGVKLLLQFDPMVQIVLIVLAAVLGFSLVKALIGLTKNKERLDTVLKQIEDVKNL